MSYGKSGAQPMAIAAPFGLSCGWVLQKEHVRIFLAEDSPAVVAALSLLIAEIPGLRLVGQAGDAVEAARGIDELMPGVLIVDIRLNQGSGLDLIRSVRQKARLRPLIIVLTSEDSKAYRQLALRLGADHFFDKSLELERLFALLRSLGEEQTR
jgi:DNA-binding NarL/FixJ family response regulator